MLHFSGSKGTISALQYVCDRPYANRRGIALKLVFAPNSSQFGLEVYLRILTEKRKVNNLKALFVCRPY